ncbi:MAG: PHP domain-containing protein [Anaerolineales bacterium]|nr:PHP domain-containing protein [Chloroflexota bacterium]MBL6981887.1 PHP domain-containing protein [Anaerolineales bacterium]
MSGLQFYKLDLHTHTPASKCYLHKDQTPEQIVQAAIEQGLAGIAVTDHNTAEWVDQMKAAAQDSGLVVFPGVEISMSEGYHLAALFDPSVDQKHVENFLGAIKIKSAEYGKSDALCKESVYAVIEQIHELGGLAVLAHIDAPKGAFFELSKLKDDGKVGVPVNCRDLFNQAKYDAVEIVNDGYPEGYDEKHHIQRFPAYYQASDNPDPDQPTKHSIAGLGKLHSWFNIEQVNLEGLRQAFNDPDARICLKDCYQQVGYQRIVRMGIGKSGFLRSQAFEFHQGLNSIIGGKGVGKSLAIEFLRFALHQPPEDPKLHEDHVKKLEKRLEIGNTVEVVYEQADGVQYHIERQLLDVRKDKHLETHQTCTNVGSGEEYKGDIPAMFPILAYSQTEVIKIAENKNAQLQLIDRFIDPRSHEQEIAGIRAKLAENDIRLASAIQARDRMGSIQVEIDTLHAKIRALRKSLENPIFNVFEKAEIKKATFDARYEYVSGLIDEIRDEIQIIKEDKLDKLPDDLGGDAELKQAQKTAEEAQGRTIKALEAIMKDLGKYKAQISDVIMVWMPEFDKLSAEYQKLLEEIGGDRKAKERERKKLEKQKAEYDKEAGDLKKMLKDLPTILDRREKLLDDLERAHRRYYEARKTKYEQLTELSDGKLQVELEHAADRSSFEEKLVDLLKGGSNAPSVSDRRKIAQNVQPRRFVQLILDRNVLHLKNEAELSETWAERTIEKLWSSDDFTEVLALQHNAYPTDVPTIRFRKEGRVYGELNELSVGQKCTALLIIALCDGTMPVVIDQPEDALDIASVWEDVAKKLRRGKDHRQFILTTHNSSVAVGGDSDQFIVLKAGAESGKIFHVGAIDSQDVRESVIDHLEGGKEPYKLRAGKYNI